MFFQYFYDFRKASVLGLSVSKATLFDESWKICVGVFEINEMSEKMKAMLVKVECQKEAIDV